VMIIPEASVRMRVSRVGDGEMVGIAVALMVEAVRSAEYVEFARPVDTSWPTDAGTDVLNR